MNFSGFASAKEEGWFCYRTFTKDWHCSPHAWPLSWRPIGSSSAVTIPPGPGQLLQFSRWHGCSHLVLKKSSAQSGSIGVNWECLQHWSLGPAYPCSTTMSECEVQERWFDELPSALTNIKIGDFFFFLIALNHRSRGLGTRMEVRDLGIRLFSLTSMRA